MSEIRPTMRLTCPQCDWIPTENLIMADVVEHMKSAHGVDPKEKLSLNLSAICTCGSIMDLQFSQKTGDGFLDHFKCFKCGNKGRMEREK